MKIRGERECQNCGGRWSYYETGTVECPECGSIHSRGLDEERKHHTASPVELDLTEVRDGIDGQPLRHVAANAKEACRRYVNRTGFLHAGELQPLSDTYLAASELLHVADVFGRSFDPTEDEVLYFLSLLRDADQGERPTPEAVPASLRDARGLAYANAVREYRREIVEWDEGHDPAVGSRLETLGEHGKRVRALEGDVPPRTAEALVTAARELADYLETGDEETLSIVDGRLARLG